MEIDKYTKKRKTKETVREVAKPPMHHECTSIVASRSLKMSGPKIVIPLGIMKPLTFLHRQAPRVSLPHYDRYNNDASNNNNNDNNNDNNRNRYSNNNNANANTNHHQQQQQYPPLLKLQLL